MTRPRRYLAALLAAALLGSAGAAAADVNMTVFKAYAAYKSGDYDKAERMWRAMAEQGSTTSMNNLANLYVQGQGVAQSQEMAAKWYRRSAEAGDSIGQLNLGLAYEGGLGVPHDNKQAADWFRKAAKQGNATAARNLGVMLATNYGEGLASSTPEQRQEALKWLEQSANANHPEAHMLLQVLRAKMQAEDQAAQ